MNRPLRAMANEETGMRYALVGLAILTVLSILYFVAGAVSTVRRGDHDHFGLIVRRSERPGRFWFLLGSKLFYDISWCLGSFVRIVAGIVGR